MGGGLYSIGIGSVFLWLCSPIVFLYIVVLVFIMSCIGFPIVGIEVELVLRPP